MTEILEQPEGVGGEPVVVVPVEHYVGSVTNPGGIHQRLELLLSRDVAQDLILKLSLPVEAYRAYNMRGFILGGINIDLDQADFTRVVGGPLRGYQCIYHNAFAPRYSIVKLSASNFWRSSASHQASISPALAA